jgi:cytochrome c-type biogenesis protein
MENSIYKGILLLSFYSLGLAIPFVFSSLILEKFLTFSKKSRSYLNGIKKISGTILLFTGILITTGKLQVTGFYLIKFFPFLEKIG